MFLSRLVFACVLLALALPGCQASYDHDAARQTRATRMVEDPRLKPSVKEQRVARAMATAQAEMYTAGQEHVTYGFDGSASQLDKVRYIAHAGALRIDYEAAADLNSVDGEPHALVLVVYHLTHTADFDQLARTEPGLRRLLEGELFADSVKGAEQHFVQPGVSARLLLNRFDGGRYVAVVAGYALPKTATSVFVTEYGLGRWAKSATRKSARPHYMYRPLPMHLSLGLGADAMVARTTGLINESLQGVHELLYEDSRYLTFDNTFLPFLFTGKLPDGPGQE